MFHQNQKQDYYKTAVKPDFFILQNGKLRELTSILGGPPDLRPELYNSDPWVEFIDLDIEEHSDRLTDLDTDCLVDRSVSSNSSPLSIGFRDDDSGRASCCDPDLPSDPEASPFHPLIPNQTFVKEPVFPAVSEQSREAMYTQVSEVRPSGKVLLSPEEQNEVDKTKRDSKKEEKIKKFHFPILNADNGGYTSELNAQKMSSKSSDGDVNETCQRKDASSSASSSPSDTMSPLAPAPVYTVVEGVDRQNSLLLSPNLTPAPQLIIPKTIPSPDGYLTPDLLGNVTP